jgi:hypothetical protein
LGTDLYRKSLSRLIRRISLLAVAFSIWLMLVTAGVLTTLLCILLLWSTAFAAVAAVVVLCVHSQHTQDSVVSRFAISAGLAQPTSAFLPSCSSTSLLVVCLPPCPSTATDSILVGIRDSLW